MTQPTSSQSLLEFWEAEFSNLFTQPLPQAPQPLQDAELLRQLSFVPGLKELLMLRQVHALEHATVWILSDMAKFSGNRQWQTDSELLGGISTDQGFYLYGQVKTEELRRAAQTALRRITSGEWDLAVHPRCGTNLSVGMLLTASLALGVSMLLPRGPIEQVLGLGVAATAAAHIAPDLGSLAQRYLTTAVPFNLAIDNISVVQDSLGRPAHFIRVRWVE